MYTYFCHIAFIYIKISINGVDFHGLSRFCYTQLGTQVWPRCARLGITDDIEVQSKFDWSAKVFFAFLAPEFSKSVHPFKSYTW